MSLKKIPAENAEVYVQRRTHTDPIKVAVVNRIFTEVKHIARMEDRNDLHALLNDATKRTINDAKAMLDILYRETVENDGRNRSAVYPED